MQLKNEKKLSVSTLRSETDRRTKTLGLYHGRLSGDIIAEESLLVMYLARLRMALDYLSMSFATNSYRDDRVGRCQELLMASHMGDHSSRIDTVGNSGGAEGGTKEIERLARAGWWLVANE